MKRIASRETLSKKSCYRLSLADGLSIRGRCIRLNKTRAHFELRERIVFQVRYGDIYNFQLIDLTEWESQPMPDEQQAMPALSADLPAARHPMVCQSCAEFSARHKRWIECDAADGYQDPVTIVVLCDACSATLIEPHPRLYVAVPVNEPVPGAMAVCAACRLGGDLDCRSPLRTTNGGGLSYAGVIADKSPPTKTKPLTIPDHPLHPGRTTAFYKEGPIWFFQVEGKTELGWTYYASDASDSDRSRVLAEQLNRVAGTGRIAITAPTAVAEVHGQRVRVWSTPVTECSGASQ